MNLPISLYDQLIYRKLDFQRARSIRKIDNKILKERKRLAREGKTERQIHQELETLRVDRYAESKILGDLMQSHITDNLLREARRLFLIVPLDRENEEIWAGTNSTGDWYLTEKGINVFKTIIMEERVKLNHARNEGWVKIITVLSGLVGALTGLMAILYQFYRS